MYYYYHFGNVMIRLGIDGVPNNAEIATRIPQITVGYALDSSLDPWPLIVTQPPWRTEGGGAIAVEVHK
jgi:hypothetical protein